MPSDARFVPAPRLEIDLDHVRANTRLLVGRLARRGVRVSGVTKATLGLPEVAQAMIDGGAATVADSRIENLERMRTAGITVPLVLIRPPMRSQCARIVATADVSLNTELVVIADLAAAARAQGRPHGVMLMLELGDLREGLLPADLVAAAREVVRLDGVELRGIGANLACQNGVAPSARNMKELSARVAAVERALGIKVAVVSGGNSANLEWAAAAADLGRVNELRLGEAILLGRETLHRRTIPGLHTDAFTLVAEVIEAKRKPSRPWGEITQNAFGETPQPANRGPHGRVIAAIGRQDIDHLGLVAPSGYEVLGASSDHLVLGTDGALPAVGSELRFGLNYSGLLRAMTSPYVVPRLLRGEAGSLTRVRPGSRVARRRSPAGGRGRLRSGR